MSNPLTPIQRQAMKRRRKQCCSDPTGKLFVQCQDCKDVNRCLDEIRRLERYVRHAPECHKSRLLCAHGLPHGELKPFCQCTCGLDPKEPS